MRHGFGPTANCGLSIGACHWFAVKSLNENYIHFGVRGPTPRWIGNDAGGGKQCIAVQRAYLTIRVVDAGHGGAVGSADPAIGGEDDIALRLGNDDDRSSGYGFSGVRTRRCGKNRKRKNDCR